MILNTVWFILITVLFIGFFFLEGFDYGVGILLPFLGENDKERRAIINTIGPFWDGNEVWMITAGGALFASFPDVYATLFSGFYIPLVVILLGLIARGVGFEFRSKRERASWRRGWDFAIFAGSLIPAFLWGVAVGNLIRGVPIDANFHYSGGLLPLLNPYALWTGLVFLGLFTTHGSAFLSIKTKGDISERAQQAGFKVWIGTLIITVIFLVWTFFATDILQNPGLDGLPAAILAALTLLGMGWFFRQGQTKNTFLMGGLTIGLATIMVFSGLFPRLMISTIDPANNLTIYNASSSPYTLKVMTVVAAIFVPLVLLYQGWSYWVFRKRIGPESSDLHY